MLKDNVGKKLSQGETNFLKLFQMLRSFDNNYVTDISSLYNDCLKLVERLVEEGTDMSTLKTTNLKQLVGEIILMSVTDVIPGTNFFEELDHGFTYVRDRLEHERIMEIECNRFNQIMGTKKQRLSKDEEIDFVPVTFTKQDVKDVKKAHLGDFDNLMLKYTELVLKGSESSRTNVKELYYSVCLAIAHNPHHEKMLKRHPRKTLIGEMLIISAIKNESLFDMLLADGYEAVEKIIMQERLIENRFKSADKRKFKLSINTSIKRILLENVKQGLLRNRRDMTQDLLETKEDDAPLLGDGKK